MRDTLDGIKHFPGGLQIGGRMITNLRYADDIILLATSETEESAASTAYSYRQDQDNGERLNSVSHTH